MDSPKPARQRLLLRDLALPCLLLFTYGLSAAWAFVIPPPALGIAGAGVFQPDEASHASIVRYMAEHLSLPPYERQYDTSVHPPLYHATAGIIYRLASPACGEAGALVLLRLLTALLGVGTVYLVYRTARSLAPRTTALFAAALVAFVPMRLSLAGAITNENLAEFAAAGVFAVLIGGCADPHSGLTLRRRFALLVFYLTVAAGSKVTCLGLLPVAAVTVLVDALRHGRSVASAAVRAAVAFCTPLAVWAWWFERNRVVYGDPFRKAAADRMWDPIQPGFAILHARTGETFLHYAQTVTTRSWFSFWGQFDGFRVMMPWTVYLLIAVFQAAAWIGLAQSGKGITDRRARLMSFLRITATAYTILVAIVFYQFNWSHYSPQGRYYFVLLLPFGILSAIGWRALWPAARRRLALTTMLIVTALLVALNLWCLWSMPGRLAYLRQSTVQQSSGKKPKSISSRLGARLESKQENSERRANGRNYGSQPLAGELRRAARPGA